MSHEARLDLEFEVDQLDKLIEKLEDALAEAVPGELYASHLGNIVHGFYNGFEKCLLFVLAIQGNPRPEGDRWHAVLIRQFKDELAEVEAVCTELRGFRHVFRNTYYYSLDYDRVRAIAEKCPSFWQVVGPWLSSHVSDA